MLPFGSFFEELDFGEDPPPPPQKRGPRIPGRGGGGGGGDDYDEDVEDGPRRGGLGGGVEVRRLALVAVAIVVVLVGGYWYVQRCQRNEEVSSYKSYVRDANAVSAQANKVAQKLQATWLKQGQTPQGLQTDLNEIAKNQQAVVNAAEGLSSPGAMKELQRRYLESQQLRLNGLTGVARQLPATLKATNGNIDTAKAAALALLWLRIASGDVVYSDSFKGPAVKLLDDKNISGVALDDSQFVGPTLLSFNDPTKMQARLETIVQGSTPSVSAECQQDPNSAACKNSPPPPSNCTSGNCIHGTSIEATTINGTTLNRDTVTDVPTDPNNQNQIVVTIKNGGDFQETQVEASAFIDSDQVGDKAIIPVFDAGTTASVTFKFDPLFNKTKQSVKIVVKPVQGEENTANNSATYQVIFKLPT
jgi:CARDB protein